MNQPDVNFNVLLLQDIHRHAYCTRVCVFGMLRLSDEATRNKSDQTRFLTSISSQEIQD